MTKQKKISILPIYAEYTMETGDVHRIFTKEQMKEPIRIGKGCTVGKVWIMRTEDGDALDDAKGCYIQKEDFLKHLEEIKFSHCSEPTDTNGHHYECQDCGKVFSIFDDVEPCTVEKVYMDRKPKEKFYIKLDDYSYAGYEQISEFEFEILSVRIEEALSFDNMEEALEEYEAINNGGMKNEKYKTFGRKAVSIISE